MNQQTIQSNQAEENMDFSQRKQLSDTNSLLKMKISYGFIGLILLTMFIKVSAGTDKSQTPKGAIYYEEHFDQQGENIAKVKTRNEKSSKVEIINLNGNKVLKISGTLRWNSGKIEFPKPLVIPSDAILMASIMSEGHGGAQGVVITLECENKIIGCSTSQPFRNAEKGQWKKLITYLGDYQPNKKNIVLSGIIFNQKVDGGYEVSGQDGGGVLHSLYVDNIYIASGKAGEFIKKEANNIAGITHYSGKSTYILSSTQSSDIWTSPSTAKVFKSQPVPEEKGNKIAISACRNEGESFQVVVSPKKDLQDISLDISSLKKADGAEINEKYIRWHPVIYKRIRHRYFATAMNSYWPEMLSWNRTIDIKKGINQPFWVTVDIPPNAHPGKYQGEILVKAKNQVLAKCQIELEVFDATLPGSPKFRTNIQVWSKYLQPWYSGKEKEVTETMRKILTEYKMYDAHGFQQNTQATRDFLLKKGINTIKLPFCGGHQGKEHRQTVKLGGALPYTEKYKTAFVKFLKSQKKYYAENGLEDKLLLYLWDEPWGDEEVLNIMKWLGEIARAEWPELKIYIAGPYYKNLSTLVDIFLEHYTSEELQKKAIEEGAEFWWWASSKSNTDMSGIDMRAAFGIESVKRNISGAFAWGIAVWRDSTFKKSADPWIYIDQYNGNDYWFYPGNNKFSKPDKIARSITLELHRDGIEDYEYADIIKNYINNGQNVLLINECKRAYTNFINSITPVYGKRNDFVDVDRLKKARYELAKYIEKVQKH